MNRKRILYISSSIFPRGVAYSTRMVNFARLFHTCGCDVHVISDYTFEEADSLKEIREFENCTYQAVASKPTSLGRILIARDSVKLAKDYIERHEVDFVLAGACYDRFARLRKLCRKNNIPLVLEITEWFVPENFKGGKLNPYYMQFRRCMKNDYVTSDKVIAISTLLQKHFAKNVRESIRIPTILDMQELPFAERTHNEKIRIMYAGFSGRGKERFDSILKALDLLGDMKSRFELHIFGCSEEAFSAKLGDHIDLYNRVGSCISVRGRIPQEEVHAEYMNADFSIFIRPNWHSNNAGFPTKLAESMTAGTPVLCNSTGDICLYLRNGHNGFLFDDSSPETIKTAFQEIAGMSDEKRMEMRRQARITAEKSFDYRNYTAQLQAFISDY